MNLRHAFRKILIALFAGLGIVSVVVLLAIDAVSKGATFTSRVAVDGLSVDGRPATVTYNVTGRARATVIYEASSGISSLSGVKVIGPGWQDTETLPPGSAAVVTAQNSTHGSITCTIRAGGDVIAANTATGLFAIASCQAP